jgi:hypothetical protein
VTGWRYGSNLHPRGVTLPEGMGGLSSFVLSLLGLFRQPFPLQLFWSPDQSLKVSLHLSLDFPFLGSLGLFGSGAMVLMVFLLA